MLLLDTDVMIDLMRGYDPAVAWLQTNNLAELALPGLVAMELLQGCRNKPELQRVHAILQQYYLYWPSATDCNRAYDNFANFRLSHGIGLLDSLIAETAVGLNSPLATFNQKHYRAIPNLQIIQPYSRL